MCLSQHIGISIKSQIISVFRCRGSFASQASWLYDLESKGFRNPTLRPISRTSRLGQDDVKKEILCLNSSGELDTYSRSVRCLRLGYFCRLFQLILSRNLEERRPPLISLSGTDKVSDVKFGTMQSNRSAGPALRRHQAFMELYSVVISSRDMIAPLLLEFPAKYFSIALVRTHSCVWILPLIGL